MPVLQLFSPELDDAPDKLEAMCREVSDALGLQPGDVVATHIVVSTTVVPGRAGATWPVVVVNGSPRTAERMEDACDRLRSLVASWSCLRADGIWVTWQPPWS